MGLYLHTWKLSLEIAAPYFSAGNLQLASELDEFLLRDEYGRICISGTHLYGHFRHFLLAVDKANDDANVEQAKRLVSTDTISAWLGCQGHQLSDLEADSAIEDPEADNAIENDTDPRGKITFRDIPLADALTQNEPKPAKYSRTRIKRLKVEKSVKTGSLQVIESSHLTGETINFCPAAEDFPNIELLGHKSESGIFKAVFSEFVEYLVAIGKFKAQGYGWLTGKKYSLDDYSQTEIALNLGKFDNAKRWQFQFLFNAPLLVAPTMHSGNIYTSSVDIPGANTKAAIAELGRNVLGSVNFDKEYGETLSEIHIGFGKYRSEASKQSTEIAGLDYVSIVNKNGISCVKFPELTDVDGDVVFQSNFKSEMWAELLDRFPRVVPEYLTRTRTAIVAGAYIAKKHALFNYQLMKQNKGRWLVEIDITRCKDHTKAHELLSLLKSGAITIGKTRSRLVAASHGSSGIATHVDQTRTLRIKLLTPAVLLSMEAIDELNSGAILQEVYAAYFSKHLGKDSVLEAFFSEEKLVGDHLFTFYPRSRDSRDSGDINYPYVTTQSGSVFYLKFPSPNKATTAANELGQFGLPSCDEDKGWKKAPMLQANGFGEVEVEFVENRKDWP